MKVSMVISLIYAHATKDEEMWSRTIDCLASDELRKGNDVLAQDIRDADKGILHTGSEVKSAKAVLSEIKQENENVAKTLPDEDVKE